MISSCTTGSEVLRYACSHLSRFALAGHRTDHERRGCQTSAASFLPWLDRCRAMTYEKRPHPISEGSRAPVDANSTPLHPIRKPLWSIFPDRAERPPRGPIQPLGRKAAD